MSLKFKKAPDGSWMGYRGAELEQEEISVPTAPDGPIESEDEKLAALAAENGIDITGKTKKQTIAALKKVGVNYAN